MSLALVTRWLSRARNSPGVISFSRSTLGSHLIRIGDAVNRS